MTVRILSMLVATASAILVMSCGKQCVSKDSQNRTLNAQPPTRIAQSTPLETVKPAEAEINPTELVRKFIMRVPHSPSGITVELVHVSALSGGAQIGLCVAAPSSIKKSDLKAFIRMFKTEAYSRFVFRPASSASSSPGAMWIIQPPSQPNRDTYPKEPEVLWVEANEYRQIVWTTFDVTVSEALDVQRWDLLMVTAHCPDEFTCFDGSMFDVYYSDSPAAKLQRVVKPLSM